MKFTLIFISISAALLIGGMDSSEAAIISNKMVNLDVAKTNQQLSGKTTTESSLGTRLSVTVPETTKSTTESDSDEGFPFSIMAVNLRNKNGRFGKKALLKEKQSEDPQVNKRTTNLSRETDTLKVTTEMKSKDAGLRTSKHHVSQENYDKKGGKFRNLKHKLLNRELAIMNLGRRNIFQPIGPNGDKDSVKFEKNVSEPNKGNKELNWIIRIKQFVIGNFENGMGDEDMFDNASPFTGNAGEMKENHDASEKELKEFWNRDSVFNKRENGGKLIKRRLLQIRGKGGSDVSSLRDEEDKKRGEDTGDQLASNNADAEPDVVKSGNTNPYIAQSQSLNGPIYKDEENPDIRSSQIEEIKKRLKDGGVSFMLGGGLQNYNDDSKLSPLPASQNTKSDIDKQIDDVVERLQNSYRMDYPRRRRSVDKENDDKDLEYGHKDDNGAYEGAKIGDLLKLSENDKQFMAEFPEVRLIKREVQDDRGMYGMAKREVQDESGMYGMAKREVQDESGMYGVAKREVQDEKGRYGVAKREVQDESGMYGMAKREVQDESGMYGMAKREVQDESGMYGMAKREVKDESGRHGVAKREVQDESGRFGVAKQEVQDESRMYGVAKREVQDGSGRHRKAKREVQDGSGWYGVAKREVKDESGRYGVAKREVQGRGGWYGVAKREVQDGSGRYGVAKREVQDVRGRYGVAKREVQDGSGSYGVAVNDDDDSIGPKEYDIQIENGVRKEIYPRDAKQEQRMRRQAEPGHTTNTNTVHGLLEGQNHHANSESLNNENGHRHHSAKHGDFHTHHGHGKIIGVGYIFFNTDGTVREISPARPRHREHNTDHEKGNSDENSPHHPLRPCNGSKGHDQQPCQEGHGKHHHAGMGQPEHHVSGRTESHSGEGSGDGFQHEGHHVESHLTENSKNHATLGEHNGAQRVPGTGGMMVETFRSDHIAGLSESHVQQAVRSGNSVQVLVILSIFLICFTIVLYIVVRNRAHRHVREMNSRTALYVPQAKY